MKNVLLTVFLFLVSVAVMAVPAKKGIWKTITLENGKEVKAQLKGDEFGHYWRTAEGKKYVSVDGICREETPVMHQSAIQRRAMSQQRRTARLLRQTAIGKRRASASHLGQKKGLILLVNFNDVKFQEGNNQAFYNQVANTPGYTDKNGFRGSVSDYFRDQSRGLFELTFDVVGPVTVSKNASYYGENDDNGNDKHPEEMVVEAIKLAKEQVTDWNKYDWDGDGEVDQVMIIFAGEGEADGGPETTIWPHEYALSYVDDSNIQKVKVGTNLYVDTYAVANEGFIAQTINGVDFFSVNGIGTICHEFSHCLGLLDMYDTGYSGNFGLGSWSIMDSGSYGGDGFVPSGYTSYDKYCIGWLEPVELTTSQDVKNMRPLTDADDVYIIRNANHPDEYYLLENRQQKGWDKYLPAEGMLVLHVDYDDIIWMYNLINTMSDGSDNYPVNDHQRCTIFHADGTDRTGEIYAMIEEAYDNYMDTGLEQYYDEYFDLWDQYEADVKGDVYPQPQNNQLSNTSMPRAFLYNKNSDGRKLMNISITEITQNADGTIAFKFAPDNSGTEEGDNTDYGQGSNSPVKPSIEGALFYESFDECEGKGGNDNLWGSTVASSEFIPDNNGWISDASYGGYQCARFGSSKKSGVATTPSFTTTNNAVLTFKAAAWGSDGTRLEVSAEGATVTITPNVFTMKGSEWTTFTANLSGMGTIKLKFTPSKRFFLDEVLVTDPMVTAIRTAETTDHKVTHIYTLDGRYVGTDFQQLRRGVYIVNGKKIVK